MTFAGSFPERRASDGGGGARRERMHAVSGWYLRRHIVLIVLNLMKSNFYELDKRKKKRWRFSRPDYRYNILSIRLLGLICLALPEYVGPTRKATGGVLIRLPVDPRFHACIGTYIHVYVCRPGYIR